MFSNSQITLLVLRTHPRKLLSKLLMILLYNLANGRVLRACQKKKSSNSPRPVPQKTSNSPRPVTHQKNPVNRTCYPKSGSSGVASV